MRRMLGLGSAGGRVASLAGDHPLVLRGIGFQVSRVQQCCGLSKRILSLCRIVFAEASMS
jgi:hypothetical protein